MLSRRSLVTATVAALAGIAILVSLGLWQLQRLQWKTALIAQVTERLAAAPVPAPGPADWPMLNADELEYQPVTVIGTFVDRDEIYVSFTQTDAAKPAGGIGYLVMSPLRTVDGWTVYVNRGFVPRERRDPGQRPEGQIAGETVVAGLLRAPHRGAWFTPADDIAGNVWFSRDPMLYAAASGAASGEVAPYIIDAFFDPALPGGLPQGGTTLIQFPNNHLGYAITWFGLAAALAAVFVAFVGRRWSGRGS